MSLQLNEIEKRLQNLIEVHLLKYLPGPSYQDRIAQRMAEALRANFSTQNLKDPDDSITQQFLLVVHPSTMTQWQKDPRLMEGLTKIFRLVASEMGLRLETIAFHNPGHRSAWLQSIAWMCVSANPKPLLKHKTCLKTWKKPRHEQLS